jgi:hypothetical protein
VAAGEESKPVDTAEAPARDVAVGDEAPSGALVADVRVAAPPADEPPEERDPVLVGRMVADCAGSRVNDVGWLRAGLDAPRTALGRLVPTACTACGGAELICGFVAARGLAA